ncbi:hypothetical protein [Thermoleophilum album]|uniref:Uncharacterized protein n=1 Tax=Thermoleophilum album TaxID=29539 RepID=A0A1H6FW04_THEAL|nr:hypothetical protein [Thermoleophilum album]SEH14976.1 hypothetical protein SAMN02745716_1800 [Thermoleophilum album]
MNATAGKSTQGADQLTDSKRRAQLALIAAPGLPHQLALELAEPLRATLAERYPYVDWEVPILPDPLVAPPASATEVVAEARRRLLDRDWELAVVLTDLPLRIGGRPVVWHASPTHGVAVVSVPAIGPVGVRRGLERAISALVDALLGERVTEESDERRERARDARRARRMRRWLDELVELHTEDSHPDTGWVSLASPGRLRLLAGMVRANRPWRVALRLYKAVVASLAAIAFSLVTPDVWAIADRLPTSRLLALSLASIATTATTLIVAHGLWERAPNQHTRDEVALFNAATALTVLIGTSVLYATLFGLALVGALLLLPSSLLEARTGNTAAFADYVRLAWLLSSLATFGGALGAGLESSDAVREAAYAYRGEEERALPGSA